MVPAIIKGEIRVQAIELLGSAQAPDKHHLIKTCTEQHNSCCG